jgi:hypothetical protein
MNCARLLLADVNKRRSKDAARPLDLAVDFEHAKLACLLLEHGAEVSMFVFVVLGSSSSSTRCMFAFVLN